MDASNANSFEEYRPLFCKGKGVLDGHFLPRRPNKADLAHPNESLQSTYTFKATCKMRVVLFEPE